MAFSGAVDAIKNAYDESTDAAKKADAAGDTVKESAGKRDETLDLQNQVQPANTRDLDKLNQSMASQPDLTPVAKQVTPRLLHHHHHHHPPYKGNDAYESFQVCGSVRSEPCTPLQCEGGDLCPPEGTPVCEKTAKCVGALPLSKRAEADAQDVKDRLDKLSGKITEAAEKVHSFCRAHAHVAVAAVPIHRLFNSTQLQETQETTNQVRKTAGDLSDKIKKTRDELEDDLKDTRDVVKELKDFLSGKARFNAQGMWITWDEHFNKHRHSSRVSRPVLQPDPNPGSERLDPESQAASQPGRPEEEAGGAEEPGSQPPRQRHRAEGGRAAAGHSQETAAGRRGRQVALTRLSHNSVCVGSRTTLLCCCSVFLEVTCFLWLHCHRDTALGVKADVDGLLEAFTSAEETISDLENKVQNATDLIQNLNDSLTQVGRRTKQCVTLWAASRQAVLTGPLRAGQGPTDAGGEGSG